MSGRHFDSAEDAQLRAKIDQAKRRLPLPELMKELGLGGHAKKSAHCPWHDDRHPSFSVFQGKDGRWHYNCFACDSCGGDEIAFLVKHFNISRREAIRRYLDMAGFPAGVPPKSHEYPKPRESREFPRSHESPKSPEYPVSPVYPMSNGQGLE
jgi:DNA primase